MENVWQIVMCLILGVALSATCGFKTFVPVLLMSVFAKAGLMTLRPEFVWLSSWPAMLFLSIATVVEILTYFIPVVDNFMDAIEIPAAIVAGTIVMASTMVMDISPMLKWALAIVAGGGVAGAVKTSAAAIRSVSTVTTAGMGNSVVNITETISSIVGSIMAILFPLLGLLVIAGCLAFVIFMIYRLCCKKRAVPNASPAS